MNRATMVSLVVLPILSACAPDRPIASLPDSDAAEVQADQTPRASGLVRHARDRTITIWVQPKAGAPADPRAELLASGAEFVSRFHGMEPIAVDVRLAQLESIRNQPWLEVVAIDSSGGTRPMSARGRVLRETLVALPPQATSWSVQWVGAPVAHARGFTGSGIKIGILDDGLYCAHPDLAGSVVASYDFAGNQPVCVNGQHGTWVVGVLGARDNAIDLLGVAPSATFYNLRICNLGSCTSGRLYDAIGYAINAGIHVLNLSTADCGGTPALPLLGRLATYASGGGLFFAAGGNGTDAECDPGDGVSSIAAAPFTIAIGAHASTGLYVPEFQYGPEIDFSAPTNTQSLSYLGDLTGATAFGGTSAATPHAAAAAAVLLSAGFPANKVYLRMKDSAVNPAGGAHTYVYGWGRIDLGIAAAAKPRVDAIDWCTGTGITVAGHCWFRATLSGGAPPIGYQFEFSRSDQPGVTVIAWVGDSTSYSIPPGDYTLSVKVTPRDNAYGRLGFYAIQEIPVCTTGGSALLGPPIQTAAATCGGGQGGGGNND